MTDPIVRQLLLTARRATIVYVSIESMDIYNECPCKSV